MLRRRGERDVGPRADDCQDLIHRMYSASLSIVLACYSRHLDLTTGPWCASGNALTYHAVRVFPLGGTPFSVNDSRQRRG